MTPITAPAAVVRTWREEATRAMHAARRPDDLVDVLRFVPRELYDLVADMSEALSRASGIFLASVANAAPADLDALAGPFPPRSGGFNQGVGCSGPREPVAVDNGCEGGVA